MINYLRISFFAKLCLVVFPVFTFHNLLIFSGKIVNEEGAPLAAVHIKGTQQGVFADKEGNFCLPVPNDETLVMLVMEVGSSLSKTHLILAICKKVTFRHHIPIL